MRTAIVFAAVLLLTATLLPAQTATQKSQVAAEVAARWLGYVDSDDYAKSWDTAADIFQKSISRAEWIQQLTAIRSPLGMVQSREQLSATYKTQLPGVPDGEYVVVRYQTRFDKKKSALETVTLTYDRDKWRVAGYFIK